MDHAWQRNILIKAPVSGVTLVDEYPWRRRNRAKSIESSDFATSIQGKREKESVAMIAGRRFVNVLLVDSITGVIYA